MSITPSQALGYADTTLEEGFLAVICFKQNFRGTNSGKVVPPTSIMYASLQGSTTPTETHIRWLVNSTWTNKRVAIRVLAKC